MSTNFLGEVHDSLQEPMDMFQIESETGITQKLEPLDFQLEDQYRLIIMHVPTTTRNSCCVQWFWF